MLGLPGSLRSAAIVCLVIGGVLSVSSSVMADSLSLPGSGDSVIVTAVIAPVREIVVNDQGVILEILSNTDQNVTPHVYKNKPDTSPLALTSAVYDQYSSLMRHTNTHKTGVIYTYQDSTPDNSVARYPEWLRLVSRQSLLFTLR